MSNGPVKKITDYPVECAVWRREDADGRRFYSTSVQKTYTKKDPNTGERVTDSDTGKVKYFRTSSLSKLETLVAIALQQHAYAFILRMEAADRD